MRDQRLRIKGHKAEESEEREKKIKSRKGEQKKDRRKNEKGSEIKSGKGKIEEIQKKKWIESIRENNKNVEREREREKYSLVREKKKARRGKTDAKK